jgi:hypothetical protein
VTNYRLFVFSCFSVLRVTVEEKKSMELNIGGGGGEEYLKKLDKCLSLILNDRPDHQDDTIISKLLDSLQSRISNIQNSSLALLEQLKHD